MIGEGPVRIGGKKIKFAESVCSAFWHLIFADSSTVEHWVAQDYSGVSVFATRVLGVDILRAFGCGGGGGGRTEAAESAERKGGGGGGSIDRRCWSCTCTSCIQGGAGSSSSSSLSYTDENCRCFPKRTRVHLRVFARVVFQGHPSFRPTSNESSRFIYVNSWTVGDRPVWRYVASFV